MPPSEFSAIAHRDRTGEGQHIDVALLDVQVAVLANQAMNFLASGQQPPRLGNAHPNIVPYQDFRTRDGYVIVTVGNDAQFRRFCRVLGSEEWADDARFSTNADRLAHRDELIPLLSAALCRSDSAHWLGVLEEAGVPCGPINGMEQVFSDQQVLHRDMKVQIPGTSDPSKTMVGNPLHLSATPVEYRSAPPSLGADTTQVLASLLNLTQEQVRTLHSQHVIAC